MKGKTGRINRPSHKLCPQFPSQIAATGEQLARPQQPAFTLAPPCVRFYAKIRPIGQAADRILQQVTLMAKQGNGGGNGGAKEGEGRAGRTKSLGIGSFAEGERIGTSLSPPWIPLSLYPGGQTSRAAFPQRVDSAGESFGCNDCSIKNNECKVSSASTRSPRQDWECQKCHTYAHAAFSISLILEEFFYESVATIPPVVLRLCSHRKNIKVYEEFHSPVPLWHDEDSLLK